MKHQKRASSPTIQLLRPIPRWYLCITGTLAIYYSMAGSFIQHFRDNPAIMTVFLRDTYHNDKAAAKKLDRALDRYEPAAPIELARVLAARAELAIALGERERADEVRSRLGRITLSEFEIQRIEHHFMNNSNYIDNYKPERYNEFCIPRG